MGRAAADSVMTGFARELEPVLAGLDSDGRAELAAYWRYHRRRYALLLDDVLARARAREAPLRILDVGPNLQTALVRRALPGAVVDTLGFEHPLFAPRGHERHVELDLNAVAHDDVPHPDATYDLVVLAEVIEHLHAPPAPVLRYLAGWLRGDGALVVQTPNAVALHKRLRMLAGRNPYEPIRACARDPGHFHEYTVGELLRAARDAGLAPGVCVTANYFGGADARGRLYAALGAALPPGLRHGITVWLRVA